MQMVKSPRMRVFGDRLKRTSTWGMGTHLPIILAFAGVPGFGSIYSIYSHLMPSDCLVLVRLPSKRMADPSVAQWLVSNMNGMVPQGQGFAGARVIPNMG